MENKGFTIIELLAILVLLAIIAGIGSYSIINVINSFNDADYKLLIDNINDAVEEYYIECKYAGTSISCPELGDDGFYSIKLGNLVTNGYLKGNSSNDDGSNILVNPKDDRDISDCYIKYSYSNGKISIVAENPTDSCPANY